MTTKTAKAAPNPPGTVAPSLERLSQARREASVAVDGKALPGDIDGSNTAIVDAKGNRGNPYRLVDTVANLLRHGLISKAMAQAADHFRNDFRIAGLEQLRAAPMERLGRSAVRSPLPQLAARERVGNALAVLGGMASPSGSVVWHVIGGEESLRAWALREGWRGRQVRHQVATGILIGALGALAVHYGYEKS